MSPQSATCPLGERRAFLQAMALALTGSAGRPLRGDAPHSLVIKGGRVFAEGRLQDLDVAVTPQGRLRLGRGLEARDTLDARGLVVSPGFVDVLSDNRKGHREIFERYKVTDGVTTALELHGGTSDARAWYGGHAKSTHWINYGAAAFATQVRHLVSSQPERDARLVRCLEDGALAVSYSIEYAPLPYAELVTYARLAKRHNRPLFLHLRFSDRERELDGVREAIRLAEETGARVHIDHLHSTGGTFHMGEALDLIRAGRARGLALTCCVYPYSYWATYPASERFAKGWQKRYGMDTQDLTVVGTGERLTEASFNRYRRDFSILVAVPEGTMPLKETVDLALREDFCLIASDGGIEREPRANSHPRGAGNFATALRHGLDIGMGLETLLAKMTELPRNLLHPALEDRGLIRDGAWADLCIFDPATIHSPATVANPNQYSLGIEAVLVNGRIAVRRGQLGARAGMAVRCG
jgi:N-acyl-D-aspartate/D-glutamate deacylase